MPNDITDFFNWCDQVDVAVFAARRVHLDRYVTALAQRRPRTGRPAVASAVARKLTALGSKLAYLSRALKTPTIGRVWEDLAAQARDLNWSHEEYLTAVLERQVAERESAGTTMRIRTAHFPQVKTLEEFNLEHLPSLRRDVVAHPATATFVAKAENVILLGPPGLGKTHLAVGLGIKAAQAGYLASPASGPRRRTAGPG
ncbi:IstB domain protein ATP-binding protein (plasmid) [Pseudonocardia dioxanivorans CB1190]|uniref:IstB domain protein ATP-binding protein n=1 Tax=Pseudonocardia dioxanivorans (strain ATCC 55486 / DSM 44775 / JCM 13855 / CB1190) TaxID=675635 RepID=F2L6R2_PSEUX|nr:IstB domain protein ATP-binding protein [Pseudonocardia dioxanivorans CB1190]GJF05076.1 hypothetical protein PSD17_40290 [Pseudonocardia sp. D17]